MNFQYTKKSQKWAPRTSQSHQNEVPRGTQSRQNNENSEKVKSNENINIYSTSEGLGHQNSPEFPCRNQQKTWLQSKCDFGLFKSEKIWKSDPERSPMGDPKSTPNCWKSILVPSECILAPNGHQNNEHDWSTNPVRNILCSFTLCIGMQWHAQCSCASLPENSQNQKQTNTTSTRTSVTIIATHFIALPCIGSAQ